MRSGFRIRMGKIFDTTIRVDWSLVFIFLLITWNLSAVLGQMHANWPVLLNLGLAFVGSERAIKGEFF